MTTTAHHLRTIATTWTDLNDALGAPTLINGFGVGLRGYLARLDKPTAADLQAEAEQAVALRALERDPNQIGERPVPIRLHVYDTMRAVEAALVDLADQIAATNQRAAVASCGADRRTLDTPHVWSADDRRRRDQLALADASDPQRWRFTGRRTAVYAALWLCARVENIRGPQRPLDDAQRERIHRVAQGAVERIERVLDTGDEVAVLAPRCKCGGEISVHGGAGASPAARCAGCGRFWSLQDAA